MVCTHPDLLARICKLVERKKFGLICFPRICFPRLIYSDQEPLQLLNVTEDWFLGVHIRLYQLDTRLFHSKITQLFPQKSRECALKLTDFWDTKLLFDLSYKIYQWELRFQPWLDLYIIYNKWEVGFKSKGKKGLRSVKVP